MRMRSGSVVAAVTVAVGALAGCGGSSPAIDPTPIVAATPSPIPSPAPTPTPTPLPSASPTPPPCQSPCEVPVTNTNPPVRLTIRLYKVQDVNGTVIAGIPESIPIGYTVTIDATPKDNSNKDTLGSGTVGFTFSDESLVKVTSNHGFQKKLKVMGAGELAVQASLDGIDSNVLVITLG
jgi:hypothetical protein